MTIAVDLDVMLRLHYVPGGHGSPVCSKHSVSWSFGHIVLCFQDLLRLVKFSYPILRYAVINVTFKKGFM